MYEDDNHVSNMNLIEATEQHKQVDRKKKQKDQKKRTKKK